MLDLDANATFRAKPELYDRVRDLVAGVCNPSSIHTLGQQGRALLEQARESLRELLDAPAENYRIIFTSGATEANNMALRLPFHGFATGKRAIFGALEHPSVLEVQGALETSGVQVELLALNEQGGYSEQTVTKVVRGAQLISIMLANNETGQRFPVGRLVELAKASNPRILFHTDAVQAVGKIALSAKEINPDMLSISGHKLGAFPGVGALLVKEGLPSSPLLLGGPQETHWRAGTENLPGIVALGLVAKDLIGQIGVRAEQMLIRREYLESLILKNLDGALVHCQKLDRLPNTCSVYIPGVRADDLVVGLDLHGFCVSSGAACASGKPQASHVLLAMGCDPEIASGTLRISVHGDEPLEEIDAFVKRLKELVETSKSHSL